MNLPIKTDIQPIRNKQIIFSYSNAAFKKMNTKISNGLNFKSILNSEFKNPNIPKIIFGIAAVVAIFFLSFKPLTDPDLFWHLKTGELIWQYKTIPSVDWYSYTMSDYGWIDHEWLTEILMFKIKDIFGLAGLSFFFAAIITFIFAYLVPQISKKPGRNDYPFYAASLIVILGTIVSSLTFGARPQILALLGTSLVFFILRRYQVNESEGKRNKIIYTLPLLFLFWANMHASFAIGIGILLACLILNKHLGTAAVRNPKADWLKLYEPFSPKLWKKAAYMGILSFTATFINPYGPRIYLEIYRTFSDNYGTNAIAEWLSPNFHAPEGMLFGFYVIFSFIILSIMKKIDILSFVLIPIFLFLAFQSARNIPLFALISMPFLIKSLGEFENTFAEIMRKKVILLGFSALLVFYPPYLSKTPDTIKSFSDEKKLAEIGSFPKNAIEFLENYPPYRQENIFNDYAWGGYLIKSSRCKVTLRPNSGQASEKLNAKKIQNEIKHEIQCEPKVFIDGRMAHWKTSERHILKDYAGIILPDDNFQKLIDEYRIKIMLLEKNGSLSRYLSISPEWKKVYSDDTAAVFEKKEQNSK